MSNDFALTEEEKFMDFVCDILLAAPSEANIDVIEQEWDKNNNPFLSIKLEGGKRFNLFIKKGK